MLSDGYWYILVVNKMIYILMIGEAMATDGSLNLIIDWSMMVGH